jgi:hypothetical protein
LIALTKLPIDYTLLPEHLRDGMKRWIEFGIRPGSFLLAILHNDLEQACLRADAYSMYRMADIAKFMALEAPAECWGSCAKVDAWEAKHAQALAKETSV